MTSVVARASVLESLVTPATPRLLLSTRLITRRFHELSAAIGDVTLFYAVKANPHPAVLATLALEGACFDVASPAETDAALATGVASQRFCRRTRCRPVPPFGIITPRASAPS